MITSGFLHTVDNCKIAYDHYLNGKNEVIVIVHGFYNSKGSELLTDLAWHLSNKYDVFIFDLRGHGKSSGLFTWTSKEGEDLKAALGFLQGKYKNTGVMGFSMGGSISINTLSEGKHEVDSLVCISAPSDPGKIDYNWWRLDIENDIIYSLLTRRGRKGKGVRPGWIWGGKEKPINNVVKLNIPTLYLHGDRDWVVGKWHSENMFSKTPGQKRLKIFDNGPHAEYLLRKHKAEFQKEIDEWFHMTLERHGQAKPKVAV